MRNHGAYHGERIDIRALLARLVSAAGERGWHVESVRVDEELSLPMLQRHVARPARRVYLSSGIHGDEPAGPLAMLRLIEEHRWPDDCDLWVCPCLNPLGFERNTRGNRDGIDLNRDYRQPVSADTRAHIGWLERQPTFDFALCLHEDWESSGFYVYEINLHGPPTLATRIIGAVQSVCPIDRANEIDGWPAREGVITPELALEDRPQWPEALYLRAKHTRQTCTLEAPSELSLETRVAALVTGVRASFGGQPGERGA